MELVRKEALFNEYKGNLYEFLVGSELSKIFNIELSFLQSITCDFQKMLSQQEQFVREYYPDLLVDLPLLARGLGEKLKSYLKLQTVKKIQIMGKAAMAANDDRFSEGDLLLYTCDKIIPISLKICKSNSYVNTKSAGIKSFLAKYFQAYPEQNIVNQKLETILDQQLYDLYEEGGLDFDNHYVNWMESNLPSLPGQLTGNFRNIYLKSLYQLNEIIYQGLLSVYHKEPEKFIKNCYALIGYSSFDVIQATTFYDKLSGRYALDSHQIESMTHEHYNINDVKFENFYKDKTSFNILFPDRILQIRIKAMNKFTSKSYKLNCSVKKTS